MPKPLISCQNLTMSYDKTKVVQDVSFALYEGDYLCIVGENGAGKSTLVKGILGLMKPSSGHIQYEGLSPNQIGYLPQQTIIQRDFPASVREVVLSGCQSSLRGLPFYGRAAKSRAAAEMQRLGISQLARRSYRDLSGGQQQRVLLARALCATTKLLLLDEPVAGLDPIVTAGLYSIIQSLNRDNGITVLMVSHDIRSAVQYGSRILQLQNSEVFFGSTQDYLNTDIGRRMLGATPPPAAKEASPC